MTLGYIGLGKMGKNMVLRLREKNIDVVAWNRSQEPLKEVEHQGAHIAQSPEDMVVQLRQGNQTTPIVIWIMLPAGELIDTFIQTLLPHLQPNDVLIDGANSFYKDTVRRAAMLHEKGIEFIDVAVSGGPSGARNGACLMIGGDKKQVDALTPLFQAIAAPDAYEYFGAAGAGHFAKMVHNGIEYGMMQAIAEGAEVLQKSSFHYDLEKVFRLYNNRSVIESRLVGWAQEAFKENPTLEGVTTSIAHSGEGEWTVKTAKELGVAVPIIEESFQVRVRSSTEPAHFSNKVVSALRGKFGGHSIK